MIQICKQNKKQVQSRLESGRIDAADISAPDPIDKIIRFSQGRGFLGELEHVIEDKRQVNKQVPLSIIITLSIAAKMKQHSSMTDIPFAITDGQTLAELGYAMWDTERDIGKGLLDEGTIRKLLGKYEAQDFVLGYNRCVQEYILPRAGMSGSIHLLDCTELEVALDNPHYEGSSVIRDSEGTRRGYKLATLRGIVGDGGIIEEVRFGTLKEHDLSLSREMILSSPMLKPGDILVNDRGFLSRELLNELKTCRGVDSYLPLRKDMDAYAQAVSLARESEKWAPHPNRKRKTQKIAFVQGLGDMWRSKHTEEDVPINGCVVWDTKKDEMYVFVTTDETASARQIIKTYEMRPEIEEEYRQLKDFWQMDDLKSTKLHVNVYHVICTLLGYLLFQLYVATEDGSAWAGKSLPVIVKKHPPQGPKSVILYAGQFFGVFAFLEMMHLYAGFSPQVREALDEVLRFV